MNIVKHWCTLRSLKYHCRKYSCLLLKTRNRISNVTTTYLVSEITAKTVRSTNTAKIIGYRCLFTILPTNMDGNIGWSKLNKAAISMGGHQNGKLVSVCCDTWPWLFCWHPAPLDWYKVDYKVNGCACEISLCVRLSWPWATF